MGTEEALLHRLVHTVGRNRRITLVLGSGICAPAIPSLRDIIGLAEDFATRGIGNPHLAAALAEVRAETGDRPADTYAAYRRTFAEWVSPTEFDIVIQRAVLSAYRSSADDPPSWERIGFHRGVSLEADLDGWQLPEGVSALGKLLAHLPERFGYRVFTTNFDPLIEVAVKRAGGRARTVSLHHDGSVSELVAAPGPVDVVHLHGYWRPTRDVEQRALLHDPEQLRARPALSRELADLLRGETVCVVGYGGGDGIFTQALYELHSARDVDVLWAVHTGEDRAGATLAGRDDRTANIPAYHQVDSDRLFPSLLRALLPDLPERPRLPGPRRPSSSTPRSSGYRYRLPAMERLLGARLDPDELLRQLDREFGWLRDRAPVAPLEVVFWPVHLRAPTLIYAVQALVAAALSARQAEVVLLLDDLNTGASVSEVRRRFTDSVSRWFALIDGARPPRVESLLAFCDPGFVAQRLQDPELAARPTHPWAVEREFYSGERTVYQVVRAAKAVPDAEANEAAPEEVREGLATTLATRLISTPAIWSYLHYVLRDHPAESVLTLGGADELIMWRSWHEAFPEPVSHLYHPRMLGVRQDAGVLGRRSFGELVEALTDACKLSDWDRPGRYVYWTAQNAVLLAQYLGAQPSSSWPPGWLSSLPALMSALRADQTRPGTIEAIAREVSSLMLHDPPRSAEVTR